MKTTFALLLSIFLFASCGDDQGPDVDCNSLSFDQEFQPNIEAIENATEIYGQDPSDDNCDALKDAYNDFIEDLEEWEDCADSLNERQKWQEALENARIAIQGIC